MLIPESLCLSAPGLLGRIVSYIEESAVHKQPQLSLCAALSAMSILKAHKVRSETNLRTNILSVALAPSGDGKGHGMKAVAHLFRELERSYLLAGVPASDVGMISSLAQTAKKLILWDEFGLDLKEMTSLRAPSYKSSILKVLMKMFSAADQKSLGLEYKNTDGKNARVDIVEPCLSLYGASTPIRFFESLNSTYVMDGFLPRLFIFEGLSGTRATFASYNETIQMNASGLVEEINERFPAGNLSKAAVRRRARIVKFSNGLAATRLWTLITEYENHRAKADIETHKAIYSRAIEHFIKLCLIAEDSHIISADTAVWCTDIMECLVKTAIEIASMRVFDSYEEKKKSELTEIVRKANVISRSELTRRTQSMKNFEREQLMKDLIEAEVIETFSQVVTEGKRHSTLFYRLK